MSVRITPEQLEEWRAAQAATGRRELGAWVRAVVTEKLTGRRGVPGDVPTVPEVNRSAYEHLVAASNNLNQLTRYSHERRELHAAIEAAAAEVGRAALAVRGLGPDRQTAEDEEHQDHGTDR